MRNLFLFIEKYRTLLLFFFLEAICLYFIIRTHNFHRSKFLNSANFVTGNVYKTFSNTIEYFYLKEVNDSLMEENAQLYSRLPQSMRRESGDTTEICDHENKQIYQYIPAKVINNTTSKINNYLTLDIGTEEGVRPNMGVIGPNGIVGIVTNVSQHFSSVMSVLHKDCRVSSKIKRTNYSGTVSWDGYDIHLAELNGIPEHVSVEKGDTVSTSGFSSIFPSEIPIGEVADYQIPSGSNFYNINIELYTQFRQLKYVYVVNYLLKHEQKNLESRND